MLMQLRVTPVSELRDGEIVRLGERVIRVSAAEAGTLKYKGAEFPVVYVSGQDAYGPARLVVLGDETLIAGR